VTSSRSRVSRWWAGVLVTWLGAGACAFEAAIPDQVVTCGSDGDCPQGFSCRSFANRVPGQRVCCRDGSCDPVVPPAARVDAAASGSAPPAPTAAGPPGPGAGPSEAVPLPPVFEGIFTLAGRNGGRCLELVGGQPGSAALHVQVCRASFTQLFRLDQLSPGAYRLVNLQSSGCLEVAATGGEGEVTLRQAACQSNAVEQSFRIEPSGAGYVRISSLKSGHCFDAPGSESGEAASVALAACKGSPGQDWLPSRTFLPSPHQIRVQHSGKCMDASMGAVERTTVRQQACTGDDGQRFRLEGAGRGKFTVVNVAGGTCLDVPMSQLADGIQIWQWSCNGTAAQWFRVEGIGGQFDRIVNVNSGKCLAVTDSGGLDGAAIEQRTCSGADNQRWAITAP
jgi:hypothetical protein